MLEEKIVIINDYETANKATCEQLRLNGFKNIFSYLRPTEALKAIPEINPDLIISDINMPELDGWQLSRILKSEEYRDYNHIPIILLSATHTDARARQLALESGASAYIQAPYDESNLIKNVLSLITPESKETNKTKVEFQKKILVVDNDINILKAFKICFEKQGCLVETADDGEKAIEAVKKMNPHIVLLDYHMPGKNGMDVLKWIKGSFPETAVIILTAHGSEATAVNFIKEGADNYIPKPFNLKKVVETCEDAFNKYNVRLINKQFKKNALELKTSEEKYKAIADNSTDMIYVLDNKGNFSFVNPAVEKVLGYDVDEIIGKPFTDFIHQDDIEKIRKNFFERRSGERAGKQFEVRLLKRIKKNGNFEMGSIAMEVRATGIYSAEMDVRDMEVRSKGLYVEERLGKMAFKGTIGIARDVTDRKRMEEQLIQTEKLSTIGILVSGIAHEINSPLTGILGYSEILLDDPVVPEASKKYISKILNEAMRCRKIVKNLLSLARTNKIETVEKKNILINEVVNDTVELLEFHLKSADIQIHVNFEDNYSHIFGDFNQIQQVLINIINNAIHAIQDSRKKGNIYIHTKIVNSKNVAILIKNDGPPVKKEVINGIFQPFFTTKGKEKGTGLGLSISDRIIKEHEGSIKVKNLNGEVLFSIDLPLILKPPSSPA